VARGIELVTSQVPNDGQCRRYDREPRTEREEGLCRKELIFPALSLHQISEERADAADHEDRAQRGQRAGNAGQEERNQTGNRISDVDRANLRRTVRRVVVESQWDCERQIPWELKGRHRLHHDERDQAGDRFRAPQHPQAARPEEDDRLNQRDRESVMRLDAECERERNARGDRVSSLERQARGAQAGCRQIGNEPQHHEMLALTKHQPRQAREGRVEHHRD
jgi:hypothetical protein